MQNDFFKQPVDKAALALTRSIALAESTKDGQHPNYDAVGDAGTSKGAYQWQPGNFEANAKEAGLDAADFSPENQDKVAYFKVKKMKNEGYAPDEIPAAWNAGLGKVKDGTWKTNKGTTTINGQKIDYDTPGYVQRVNKYYNQVYQQMAGAPASQGQVPTPQANDNGFVNKATIVPSAAQPTDPTKKEEQKPGLIQSAVQGLTSPLLKMTAGASTLGGSLLSGGARLVGKKDFADKLDKSIEQADKEGIDYGYFGKVKPVGAGFDVRKSVGENVAPLADSVGTGAQLGAQIATGESLLKGASGLYGALKGAHSATTAAAPIVNELTGAPIKNFTSLGPVDKFNMLDEALKAPGLDAAHRVIIERAMEEIAPHIPAALGVGSFAELHPALALSGGVAKSALTTLFKWGLAGAGFAGVNNLTQGLIPK